MHPFPGFRGVAAVVVTIPCLWAFLLKTKKFEAYNLDPQGAPGAFEPLLQKYIRLAEFVVGLASGSIVLLVGSSVFHGQGGKLPWVYASPLLVLAASVLTGLLFMAQEILSYEENQHGNPHTAKEYALSETLGFSCLLFFVIGYAWLIVGVTR